MIKLVNIEKIYRTKDGTAIHALRNISLNFANCGMISILGRNGCGKTTLLNIIGGLDRPDSGKVEYNGRSLADFSASDFDSYRNNCVAYIFQDYNLISDYSVEDNIKLAVRLQNTDEKKVREKTEAAIAEIGLSGYEKRKISELSGGQRQRVVLARALAKESAILLCDEPTGNVDEESAETFFSLLHNISKERLVIVVTHDSEIAEKYSDAIIRLKDGEITGIEGDKNCFDDGITAPEKNTARKVKQGGFTFVNTLRYAGRNIKSSWLPSVAVFLILTICFSFLLTFYSLSKFSLPVAMNNTLNANGATVVSFTKYADSMTVTEDDDYIYGRSVENESVSENDLSEARRILGDDAVIYKSYIFNLYLDYLTENDVDFEPTDFYSNCFTEFIAIDDFNTYHQALAYGQYPQTENQILIYDYMAENMLAHGGFSGAECIEDFSGYTLTDRYSGISYEISGILKSNYELYRDIDKGGTDDEYATMYLASLQAIVGNASFLQANKDKLKRAPLYRCYYTWDTLMDSGNWKNESLTRAESASPFVIDEKSISNLSLIGTFNPTDCYMGVLVSRGKIAGILNMDISDVTDDYINELLVNERIGFNVKVSFINGDIDKTSIYSLITGVIGVYEGDSEELFMYLDNENEGFILPDTKFRQFYISLGENDEKNLELLTALLPEEKSEEFFLAHPGYNEEGFILYSPYLYLIQEAVEYLDGMSDVGWDLFIVCIILVIISVIGYGAVVIKKRRFEIGLFKSLGVSNSAIAAIFGTEVVIILFLSFIGSLVGAPILVGIVDNAFTSDLFFPVTLFRIYAKDIFVPACIGFATAAMALVLPIVRFLRMQPVNVMRNARK